MAGHTNQLWLFTFLFFFDMFLMNRTNVHSIFLGGDLFMQQQLPHSVMCLRERPYALNND